jgi:hypothetical protein
VHLPALGLLTNAFFPPVSFSMPMEKKLLLSTDELAASPSISGK